MADSATSTLMDTTETAAQPTDDPGKLRATIKQQASTIAELRDEVSRLASMQEEDRELIDDWIEAGSF